MFLLVAGFALRIHPSPRVPQQRECSCAIARNDAGWSGYLDHVRGITRIVLYEFLNGRARFLLRIHQRAEFQDERIWLLFVSNAVPCRGRF